MFTHRRVRSITNRQIARTSEFVAVCFESPRVIRSVAYVLLTCSILPSRREMNIEHAAIVSLTATGFVSCRSADLVQAGPKPATVRQQRVHEVNRRVQLDVANAGCALGLSSGAGGSRVIMLQRDRLPFKLATLTLPANSVHSWRMQVARVSIPLSAPRSSSALLACLVPMNGSALDSLKKAVARTTVEDWEKFAAQVANEGSQESFEPVPRSRESTA